MTFKTDILHFYTKETSDYRNSDMKAMWCI